MAGFNRDGRNGESRGGFQSRNRSFGGDRGSGRGGDRPGFSRGRSSFGGGRSFGGDREMFKAVCDNCGKDCEVPFRPTSGKPVYCSDCFEKMGGGSDRGERRERPERSEFPGRSQAPRFNQDKVPFDALNAKLDKILRLLEPKTEETVVISEPVTEVTLPKVKKIKKTASKK